MPTHAARLVIRGAAYLNPCGARVRGDVLIHDGVIRGLGRVDDAAASSIDANGYLIAPAFIDVHVHGAGGDVFEQGSVEGNLRICAELARFGTAGVVATVATLPIDVLRDAVAAIAVARSQTAGAQILGIHLEGPYLNPKRCGAQNPQWMRPPSIDEVDDLQRVSAGLVRMVTVAPELDGCIELIRALRARNITVAMGHTEATTEQVEAAIAAGVTHVTHLFNAMSPLHHRVPGAVGVALTEDDLTVEVICDGHHLHPRTVDLVFRAKPGTRVALVSDSVAAGIGDGVRELFGMRCEVRDGAVRMTAGGQLAGSCLTLDAAVRNLHAWQPRRAIAEVLACASAVPAQVIDRAPVRVEMGSEADLVLLSDDMRVAATFVQGRCVWKAAEIRVAQGVERHPM